MTLTPHSIQPAHGSKSRTKRVGRGNGSQKGTMSGRGGKGQTARSGGRRRNARRALKHALATIPKLRGFHSMYKKLETITLTTLNHVTKPGDVVTPHFLHMRGVVDMPDRGVKLVSTGVLNNAVTLRDITASKKAIAAVEKAGGKFEKIVRKAKVEKENTKAKIKKAATAKAGKKS